MAGTNPIGEWFDQSELEGWRRNIIVGPGHAAIVITNGEYGEPRTEEKVPTRALIPNPFNTDHIEVLKADLTPFNITYELLGPGDPALTAVQIRNPVLTKDANLVTGQVALTLQVDPERPGLLFQLRQGRLEISPYDIAVAIRDIFFAVVITAQVAEIESAQLRGTAGVLETLYSATRLQLEQQLRAYGLKLINFAPALLPHNVVPGGIPNPKPEPTRPPGRVRKEKGPPWWRFIAYVAVLVAAGYGVVWTINNWDPGGGGGSNPNPTVSVAGPTPTPTVDPNSGIYPPNSIVVNHWATGHFFFDGGLQTMADRFNAERHTTADGKLVIVEMSNNPSSLQASDLLLRARDGVREEYRCCPPGGPEPHPDPTMVTPSSAHWLIKVNDELQKVGKPNAVDLDAAESIAVTYIGIVTYRDMATCLGWPEKKIGYADIIALRDDPRGWSAYDCAKAEWGTKPLVAFTDPKTSSTGRSVLLALYAIAAEIPPEDLTLEDISDPDNIEYVKHFQSLIDHYMVGTTALLTKIHQGPRFGHFLLMPEDNLIHLKEGGIEVNINGIPKIVGPYSESMVMIYPKEGSMTRSNCACIVSAPWVSEEEKIAAQVWIDYLREEEQQRVFLRRGFRPAAGLALDPADPDNRFTDEFGLNPDIPDPVLNVLRIKPDVAAAIDDSWINVKRPGMVSFVVDTSGSMKGEKMEEVKDGLLHAFDSMATHNLVGLITFANEIETIVPMAPLVASGGGNKSALGDAVHNMKAIGQTALYEAIEAGVEMVDRAPGEEGAIRAVVVVTDGRSNRGVTELDDIITMVSKDERPIADYPGTVAGPDPRTEDFIFFSPEDITGTDMAIDTDHDILIFFIGIGEDADLTIGALLAEGTGAVFRGVTEEDLSEVLEEFSVHF